jgi:type IV secretory pathway TraG/TraD family ATPase VirD4
MAKNRKAAREAAQIASDQGLTLAEVHRHFLASEYWQEEAPGFIDKLGELAGVAAINASQGAFTLSDMVASGGAVYVVGSMTLTSVLRAQQMIFVRVQQLATARDRLAGPLKTVCVVADEMRFHISKPVIQGLAASRDKGMRVVLAFQSFTDLKDCPASLNPEMVIGAVIENTPAKLIYKLEDPDTADWLQRKSGIIQVDDETKVLNRNVALSETTEGERSVRQAEHFLFDTNKLSNLPPGWGVLFGQGLAQACYVSAVPVKKCREAITPEAAEENTTAEPSQKSSNSDVEPETKSKSGSDDDFFTLK